MSLHFVSVVRQGLSIRYALADPGAGSASMREKPLPAVLGLDLIATVSERATKAVAAQLLGPGEVAGIDPRQVLRCDPANGARRVDTSLFAQIEFDDPALPWMFTPLAANNGRLRPWLALVVMERLASDAPLDLGPLKLGRLPILTVDEPADLPPYDETWAWAHAQVAVTDGTLSDPAAAIAQHPEAALSRLICPRKLHPGTEYVACVVPTFAAGRDAGLGDAGADTVAPAWDPETKYPLRLPVYHHWEFFTGEAGDFEEAVRRLRRTAPPARAGRVLDASAPGRPEVADPGAAALPLAGALRPETLTIPAYNGPAAAGYAALSRAGDVVAAPSGRSYPVVNIPLYGGRHVGVTEPTVVAGAPQWVQQLNTDPRHRVAAAFGARIVRENEEELMESAWQQVGAINEANRRRRLAQLGRAAATRIIDRHIRPLDDENRLRLLAPALTRIDVAGQKRTIAALIADSRVPALAIGASFTALLRPGGRITRNVLRGADSTPAIAGGIDAETISVDRSRIGRPGGLVTLDGVLAVLDAARRNAAASDTRTPVTVGRIAPTRPGAPTPAASVTTTATGTTTIRVFDTSGIVAGAGTTTTIRGTFTVPSAAAIRRLDLTRLDAAAVMNLPGTVSLDVAGQSIDATQAYKLAVAAVLDEPRAAQPPPAMLDLVQIVADVMAAIDPDTAIVKVVSAGINIPAGLATPDPLDEVLAAPQFPAPLAVELVRLAPDMVLPGLEEVDRDRVFAVVPNKAFVHALLTGANFEMMRELRWRGYPTDERGTCFRRFWRADADEIADLHTILSGALGAAVSGGTENVVVVVRSELLQRFPGTQILAVPAVTGSTPAPDFTQPELPVFRGTIAADVAYFGFAFTAATARAQPGRYLVFQQPFGAPSFGLDVTMLHPRPFPTNARDLTWSDVTMAGDYVRANTLGGPFADNGATWGANAADQATSTLQQPVRAAVHFRDLLGDD